MCRYSKATKVVKDARKNVLSEKFSFREILAKKKQRANSIYAKVLFLVILFKNERSL